MTGEYLEVSEFNQFSQRMDAENSFMTKRIEKLEQTVEQITKLTISVEKMAISMENMTTELKSQGQRLADIEEKPAKNWDKLVWIVGSVVITAVITFLLTRLGLK